MTTPSIIIFRGFQNGGTHVWSPFVNKLEARFRFAGLSYKVESGSPMKGPKGKIPYIHILEENQTTPTVLGDTALIISQLEENGLLDDLNANLTPIEKANDLAIRALLEDKLYFYQNYERWHLNYYTMRPGVLWALPYPIQIVVGHLAYRAIARTLQGQGTMRYTYEEISGFRQQIWESINALLIAAKQTVVKKESKYADDEVFWVLGGENPTEADATLYGFIASCLVCTAGPDSMKVVKSFATVMEYARRIHQTYFPDYALWDEA